MSVFEAPTRNRILTLLIAGWLLCIVLAAVLHWRVFAMFGVLLLVGAILFLMISVTYALIGEEKKPAKKDPENES